MPGLSSSRWASGSIPPLTSWPRPAPSSSTAPPPTSGFPRSVDNPSPEQELSRFLKIVARLNWKLPSLNRGYEIATSRVGNDAQQNEANEIHFKLDFHEFYMLLERALVHLMGVYGIEIHGHGILKSRRIGDSSSNTTSSCGNDGIPDAPKMAAVAPHSVHAAERITRGAAPLAGSRHKYHHNVLIALDSRDNPLHDVLGTGEARAALSRAKELRNRWKFADDPDGAARNSNTSGSSESNNSGPKPLESYNLEQMLQTIFAAFDQAYLMTEQYLWQRITSQEPGGDSAAGPISMADWSTESEDWGFILDAMDWEAV